MNFTLAQPRIARAAFAACLVLAGTTAAQAAPNLLVNGSFEDGTFMPDGNGAMSLLVGSTAINGWTVVAGSTSWTSTTNNFNFSAFDGNKLLDLTDYRDSPPYAGVTQTIATHAGATYLLSFELGSANQYGRPNTITASAGSTSGSFTGSATGTHSDWQLFALPFTATGATTAITLTGTTGAQYIGLDDVSVVLVTDVPEPATWLLMVMGVAGIAVRGLRRTGQNEG